MVSPVSIPNFQRERDKLPTPCNALRVAYTHSHSVMFRLIYHCFILKGILDASSLRRNCFPLEEGDLGLELVSCCAVSCCFDALCVVDVLFAEGSTRVREESTEALLVDSFAWFMLRVGCGCVFWCGVFVWSGL